jgi:hypothetical protein
MKRTLLSVCLLLTFVQGTFAQKERHNLGLNGLISYGAMGSTPAGRGVRGDTVLLGCQAEAHKQISVGVYLFYRDTKKEGLKIEGVGDWKGVPVVHNAKSYTSQSLNCAGISTTWRQSDGRADMTTVQLFMPYEALALPRGNYEVVYRVRAWVDGKLVDDFYTDTKRIVNSTGSTWYEHEYMCYGSSGPQQCEFRLVGTSDPPIEKSNYGREPVKAE